MQALAPAIQLLAAACLGVYAGAMLTEGFVLVPWWQSLAAADFLAWYAANDQLLLDFFEPLTTTTLVATLLSAAVSIATGHPSRWLALASALLTVAAVASYFVYFEAANASFSSATIAADAVPRELARWGAWHHARTLIAAVAFACALLALRRRA
jgi:uncharacterized membrane protein